MSWNASLRYARTQVEMMAKDVWAKRVHCDCAIPRISYVARASSDVWKLYCSARHICQCVLVPILISIVITDLALPGIQKDFVRLRSAKCFAVRRMKRSTPIGFWQRARFGFGDCILTIWVCRHKKTSTLAAIGLCQMCDRENMKEAEG